MHDHKKEKADFIRHAMIAWFGKNASTSVDAETLAKSVISARLGAEALWREYSQALPTGDAALPAFVEKAQEYVGGT